jgi:hypothetical protein
MEAKDRSSRESYLARNMRMQALVLPQGVFLPQRTKEVPKQTSSLTPDELGA